LGSSRHQRTEGRTLRVGHLAGLGRQVAAVQAVLGRRLGNLVEVGLVGAFAVGRLQMIDLKPASAKAFRSEGRDLRCDRQGGGERFGMSMGFVSLEIDEAKRPL
jgi:hypothetical protein